MIEYRSLIKYRRTNNFDKVQLITAPKRSGKTKFLSLVLDDILKRRSISKVLIIAPSTSHLLNIVEYRDKTNSKRREDLSEKELIKSICKNGERSQKIRYLTNKNNLRTILGINFDYFIVDEATSIKNEIFLELLQPLMYKKIPGTIIGTPRNVNYIWRCGQWIPDCAFKHLLDFAIECEKHSYGPILYKEELIKEKNLLTDTVFRTEILGEWVSTYAGI